MLPEASPPASTTCPAGTTAITHTGDPLVTVAAGHAYHLGVHILVVGYTRTSDPVWVLNGARVRYACPRGRARDR